MTDRLTLARGLAVRIVRRRARARVLVTRPTDQSGSLVAGLDARGIDAVVVPTIEIRDVAPGGPLDEALARVVDGDWLVATSPNGVRAALSALARVRIDPATLRWAVIGAASAAVVRERGTNPFVPSRATGEALAAELPLVRNDRVLLARSDLADPRLVAKIAARGAAVSDVVAYRTVEAPESSRQLLAAALAEPIDALAFASGSAVRGLLALAPVNAHDRLRATLAVCIGSTTAGVAGDLGFASIVESTAEAADALADAVVDALAASLPPAFVDVGTATLAAAVAPAIATTSGAPGGIR